MAKDKRFEHLLHSYFSAKARLEEYTSTQDNRKQKSNEAFITNAISTIKRLELEIKRYNDDKGFYKITGHTIKANNILVPFTIYYPAEIPKEVLTFFIEQDVAELSKIKDLHISEIEFGIKFENI